MKKRHGIWIGLSAGLLYAFTNDLALIVVGLPWAIYIVLKAIDVHREENNKFLYQEIEDARWICTLPELKAPEPSWYQREQAHAIKVRPFVRHGTIAYPDKKRNRYLQGRRLN